MTLTPEAKQDLSVSDTPLTDALDSALAAQLIDLRSEGVSLNKAIEHLGASLMAHARRMERQLSAITAERDALQSVLLRNGFTQCDIAACNCGSWHHRYGLPERWEEIKEALREADVLDNSVGNLPLNAIKRLVGERDALKVEAERRAWQPIEAAPKDGTVIILYGPPCVFEGKEYPERVTCGHWQEWENTASEYHSSTGEYLGQSVQDCGEGWLSWDGGFRDEEPPTHWMPLPPAIDAARAK